MGSTKGRRKLLISTPDSTPEHPRVHIRMKVLLQHILEMLLLGPHGNDLHLGQKPKLGRRYTDISLIYIYHILIGPLYIHILLSFVLFLFLFPKTQKDQKDF